MTTFTISHDQNGTVLTGTERHDGQTFGDVFRKYGFSWWPRQKVWGIPQSVGHAYKERNAIGLQAALEKRGIGVVIGPIATVNLTSAERASAAAARDAGRRTRRGEAVPEDLELTRYTPEQIDEALTVARRQLDDATWRLRFRSDPSPLAAAIPLKTVADIGARLKLGAELSAVTTAGVEVVARPVSTVTYDTAGLDPVDGAGSARLLFGDTSRYIVVDPDSFASIEDGQIKITYTFVKEGLDSDRELVPLRESVHYWEKLLAFAVTDRDARFWGPEDFAVGDIVTRRSAGGWGYIREGSITRDGLRPKRKTSSREAFVCAPANAWPYGDVASRERVGVTVTRAPGVPKRVRSIVNRLQRCDGVEPSEWMQSDDLIPALAASQAQAAAQPEPIARDIPIDNEGLAPTEGMLF